MLIQKAEIEKKRKHLDSVAKGAKYIKRSALEETRVSEQIQEKEQTISKKKSCEKEEPQVPLEEIIKRFRAKNEPIKLFDESDSARLVRLGKIEAREESKNGQRNDYLEFLDANEEESELKKIYGNFKNSKDKDLDNPDFDTSQITADNFITDPQRVSKLISVYFQRIIRDWETSLENRSQDEKKSTQGKRLAGNCSQSKEYLKPFFKKLRKGQIDHEILLKIVEMCEYMQIREYQKANDVYLKLSIGNAAWPIGISGTSIHERSALERIETSKSAGHVLNDEVCIFRLNLKDYEKMDSKH